MTDILTPAERAKLVETAKAATPGPWMYSAPRVAYRIRTADGRFIMEGNQYGVRVEADAAHIAANAPDTTLRWEATVQALERKVDELEAALTREREHAEANLANGNVDELERTRAQLTREWEAREQIRALIMRNAASPTPTPTCTHASRTGGNDYVRCNDCGIEWDYRQTPTPGELSSGRDAREPAASTRSRHPAGPETGEK